MNVTDVLEYYPRRMVESVWYVPVFKLKNEIYRIPMVNDQEQQAVSKCGPRLNFWEVLWQEPTLFSELEVVVWVISERLLNSLSVLSRKLRAVNTVLDHPPAKVFEIKYTECLTTEFAEFPERMSSIYNRLKGFLLYSCRVWLSGLGVLWPNSELLKKD